MKKICKKVMLCLALVCLIFAGACSPSDTSGDTGETTNDETVGEETTIADENEDTSLADVLTKGKIVMATSADYAPYEFHMLVDGKDEIVGFDIEIAKKIAEALDVELQIIDMNFDGLISALQSGEADMVLACLNPTEKRKAEAEFTEMYYEASQVALIRTEDTDKFDSIESLTGYTVAAQLATQQEKILNEQFEGVNPVLLQQIPNMVMELKTNKVDAVLMEGAVAEAYAKQHEDVTAVDIGLVVEADGAAVACKKGNIALTEKINEILQDLIAEGIIEQLYQEADQLATASLGD